MTSQARAHPGGSVRITEFPLLRVAGLSSFAWRQFKVLLTTMNTVLLRAAPTMSAPEDDGPPQGPPEGPVDPDDFGS
jgi:hypothetical protein